MRKPNAIPGGGAMPLDREKNKRTTWVAGNRDLESLDETSRKILAAGGQGQESSGTSIFDPVLCELVYKWFCPRGGSILDPFAGGSVRGIVAAHLGFQYTGVDLRAEQIQANYLQAQTILKSDPVPVWHVGNSEFISALAPGEYDLVFSCPPYADLEVYSENPDDLSVIAAEDYGKFKAAYQRIIAASVGMLRQNRFACFVVGDVRGPGGFYRNLVRDTVEAFEACGAQLYNEAILVTAVGSLPIRIGRQFTSARKLGKTHQNVLVFFKGDPAEIKLWPLPEFGEVATDPAQSLPSPGTDDQEESSESPPAGS